MKIILQLFCALCALMFFNHVQAAPGGADESRFQLTIELRDGSRIVGKSLDDTLSIHSTALGDAKLAWSGIRSIEYTTVTNTARLTVTNGDTFTVQLTTDSLRIDTDFGTSEVAVKLVKSIKVSAAAGPKVIATTVPAEKAGLQLTIELRDGSHVAGKGLDDSLNFHSTALGDLKLPWTGIRSIEYATTNSANAKLTTTNDEAYVVRLTAPTIRVETRFGTNELPVNLIRSIKTSTPGATLEYGTAWENSLGMKFVSVPGAKVMFCIWDVRVKDYTAYAQANNGVDRNWENLNYKGVPVAPSADCPVVNVSWDDAKAFCEWLTQKERAEGKISNSQIYRLPRMAEWRQAAGNTKYPWGDDWMPPTGAGNFADSTAKQSFSDLTVIDGYDDGFATTSPVGSFAANKYGLFDMAGNVLQWCEDRVINRWGGDQNHAMCGSSWRESNPKQMLSSYSTSHLPTSHADIFGFRVVLADNALYPSDPPISGFGFEYFYKR